MAVPVEVGTLPLGIDYEGELCSDFVLRPLQSRDSMEIRHSEDMRRIEEVGQTNQVYADELMGLMLLSRRLQIDGVPREAQTLEFMEHLWDDDLAEIMAAEGRLQEQLARFRGKAAPEVNPGPAANGDSLAGRQDDAAGRGSTVGGGLGGTQESEAEREDGEDPAPAEEP